MIYLNALKKLILFKKVHLRSILKQSLYKELGEIVPKNVLFVLNIWMKMTDIQTLCKTPERTVVAHPFNPPYLLPLVEIVGGKKPRRSC